MVQVTIDLPEDLAEAFGKTAETRKRTLTEDAVIEAYREGRLSHRQVGKVLGLDYWQTEDFFLKRGVPLNYTVTDLEADRATMDELLSKK